MRKFILKLLLLFIPMLIIIASTEIFVNQYLNNNSFYKINCTSNVIILGNSHSECAINDSLLRNCVNLSQGGECYFYTYYKLKKIIDCNPNIDTILLEYTNNILWEVMDNWIYGEEFLGNKYPKYSQLISIEDKIFLFRKNPGAYLIAFKDAIIMKFRLISKKEINVIDELRWGEYLYLIRNKIPQIKDELKKSNQKGKEFNRNMTTSKYNVLYLKKIVDYCRINKIKLILFRSPLHKLYEKKFDFELFSLLNTDYKDLEFWDYSNFPLDDDEFGDLEHLNYKGAIRFSKYINLKLNAKRD
jgi:hypothetical protein